MVVKKWFKVVKNEIRGNITSYNTRYAMFPNFRFHPDSTRTTEQQSDNSKTNISKLATGQTLIITRVGITEFYIS